jgi:hypothetical protein
VFSLKRFHFAPNYGFYGPQQPSSVGSKPSSASEGMKKTKEQKMHELRVAVILLAIIIIVAVLTHAPRILQ